MTLMVICCLFLPSGLNCQKDAFIGNDIVVFEPKMGRIRNLWLSKLICRPGAVVNASYGDIGHDIHSKGRLSEFLFYTLKGFQFVCGLLEFIH